MRLKLAFTMMLLLAIPGCGRLELMSPNLKNELQNQQGEIEDIKSNQNGVMADILNLRQQADIHAQELHNFQQGYLNYHKSNNGVQVLQGDGALIFTFSLAVIFMLLFFHYRNRAVKTDKATKMLATALAWQPKKNWQEQVVLEALNSGVEKEISTYLLDARQKVKQLKMCQHKPTKE